MGLGAMCQAPKFETLFSPALFYLQERKGAVRLHQSLNSLTKGNTMKEITLEGLRDYALSLGNEEVNLFDCDT